MSRFVIGSVTGFHVNPQAWNTGGINVRPPVLWYVWDTEYAHRVIAEYSSWPGSGWSKAEGAQYRAEAKAAELNAWDAAL